MWQCKQGKCVLVPSGPGTTKHLFAIVLDPTQLEGYGSKPCVIMVGVTSIKEGVPHDDACELLQGDHPFIKHPCYVDYRYARIEQAEAVERHIQNGLFNEKEDCSPELLQRLVRGALTSRRISREIRLILEKSLS